MLKVGDTVKVIAATEDAGYCDGRKIEYIPIGTICTVVETDIEADGSQSCAVDCGDGYAYWYKANELEKGHMEWISEHKKQMWIKRYAFFYKKYLQYIVDDMPLQLTNKFEVQLQEIQIVLREIFHIQNEEIEKINHELEERIL